MFDHIPILKALLAEHGSESVSYMAVNYVAEASCLGTPQEFSCSAWESWESVTDGLIDVINSDCEHPHCTDPLVIGFVYDLSLRSRGI